MMITYLECMQERYIPSPEVVLSNDHLMGCFLSCLVDDSGNAIIGYRGSQSFDVHAREISELLSGTDFGDVVRAELFYLREEDRDGALRISSMEYQQLVEQFKEALEKVSGVVVELKEYRYHSGFRLTKERELVIG
jgi:hypothetical protein